MDVPKVAPAPAVDQLQQVLDSPEVRELIGWVNAMRWTGRPGYPVRAMIGMCLIKSLYAIPTWSRIVRLVSEHDGLQRVLACAPSQWACYRFAKMLRTRDSAFLDKCVRDVLTSLREVHPNMGQTVAIDGSDLPAYANGHATHHDGRPRKVSDPDASWGHRSAVSTRGKGPFYGYKIHACVDTATELPLAWTVQPGNESEMHFPIGLLDTTRARGFDVQTMIADKGYDSSLIYAKCEHRNIAPVIPLVGRKWERTGAADAPNCAHGEWTFAGADYQRKATKWRCPTGECQPGSMWVKASRLHPLIPRQTKRYRDLYRSRQAVERNFGRLKHEWSLLPLRVRGVGRVQLHADLTILAVLASALTKVRQAEPLATAA